MSKRNILYHHNLATYVQHVSIETNDIITTNLFSNVALHLGNIKR